jgi:iron complex outermembrane receptor protein
MKGAASNEDLPLLIPGLTLQPSGSSSPVFLRGVGNAGVGNSGAAVLTFIDGVLQPYNTGTQVFNNVASIEVDKGPQGTLFGRNATGGVIQIATKDPSFDPKADISIGYGNYNTINASAYVSAGLGHSVATDLSFYYNNQQNGWGTNFADGKDVLKKKDLSLRSKTLIEVGDNTKIHIMLDYKTSGGSVGTNISPSIPEPILFNEVTGEPLIIPGHRNVDSNYDPLYRTKEGGAAIRIDHDFGIFRALSITSYRRNAVGLQIDYDGSPINFLNITRHDDQSNETQEFQLLSPDESKIKWVVGAYYYHISSDMDPFGFSGIGGSVVFGAPEGVPFNINARSELTSYAGFAQATATLFKDTRLTVGARYTIDKTSVDGFTAYGDDVIPRSSGGASKTYRKPTFRAILEHNFTHDVLVYASYNRGYNAGGFNLVSTGGFAPVSQGGPGVVAVQPETIDAYEVGIKSEFLDHHVRFNASGFLYNYSNLQQQIYVSGGLSTVNAAKARIKGIDAELTVLPVHDLTLSGGLEYLDSRFVRYPDAPIYSLAPNGALLASAGDASGNYTPSAPKFSYNVSANYTLHSGVGKFDTSAIATYTGAFFGDASNNFREPGHYLVNLTETWTSNDGKTQFALWAKNVGNRFYDQSVNLLTPLGVVSNPGAPRTYGFTATRHF